MRFTRRALSLRLLSICLFGIVSATNSIAADGAAPVSFREQIAPILLENCVSCHSAKRVEGGYRLDTVELLFKAGESGATPIVPSKSKDSEVSVRICTADTGSRMPADSEPLKGDEQVIIGRWIDEGASVEGINANEPLWQVISPKQYSKPPEHYSVAQPITAIFFSPDGSQLITSGYHEAIVWNVADGTLVQRIVNLPERTFAFQNRTDGSSMFVAGGSPGAIGEVRLVNKANGNIDSVFARSNDVALDIAIRPGKNEAAVAMTDNTIRIIDLDSMQQRKVIASHADWVLQVSYSDDGKRLGSASRDKSAKVYDAETGDLLASYPGHGASVRGIAAIGDGTQWMTAGADNKLHRWEVEGAKRNAEVQLGGEPSKLFRFENVLLAPSADRHLYRIDLTNNAVAQKLGGHDDWVISAAYHAGTGRLAAGSLNGSIRVWNAADGSAVSNWIAKP